MTQTSITETIETMRHANGTYAITTQHARCKYCASRIQRVKPLVIGLEIKWGHTDTGRSICLLPADTSKVATPR